MADPVVVAPVAPVVPPTLGTPEYDAAMAAKFDSHQSGEGAPPPSPDAPKKPEHVPEKFWDAKTGQVDFASWAKSTQEAEAKITELAKGKPSATPPADGATPPQDDAQAAQALQAKGMDLNVFTEEFVEKGALTPESYAKLEAAGYTKEVVDQYIEGRVAVASQRDSVAYEAAGGEESYTEMAKWAAVNLTPAERQAYNDSLRGSVEQMKLAIGGLKARYQAASGSDPQLVGGARGAGDSGFESMAQVTAAMKDPRYGSDPAYRKQVEQKLDKFNW